MKQIIEYIQEKMEDFKNKGLQTLYIIDSLNEVISRQKIQPNSISLSNKTETKKFHTKLLDFIGDKYGDKVSLEIIRKYEIGTPESFAKFMYMNAEDLQARKVKIEIFKDFNESEAQKEYNRLKKEGVIEEITDEEAEENNNDNDLSHRQLVVYARYNPSEHMTFKFPYKRGKASDNICNACKAEFKRQTGTKYFECYPILWSNYIKMDKDKEVEIDIIGLND